MKDLPNSLKWHSCYAVRALFRENYRELESAAGKYEYSTQKPQRTPSKEQRLKLFNKCYTPTDKALIMFSTTTAIARYTMSKLRLSYFEENWQRQEIPAMILAYY